MDSGGEHVAVEAVTDCRLRDGGDCRDSLSYWMKLSGSKIANSRAYFDGSSGRKVIGAALAAALGDQH